MGFFVLLLLFDFRNRVVFWFEWVVRLLVYEPLCERLQGGEGLPIFFRMRESCSRTDHQEASLSMLRVGLNLTQCAQIIPTKPSRVLRPKDKLVR